MKRTWVIERKEGDQWKPIDGNNNYFKFTSIAKKQMQAADEQAILLLNKDLGQVPWSEEIREIYKKAHNDVKNSFRIVEGEIPDDCKDWKQYKFVKENSGVMSYLWNTKTYKKEN